MISKSNKRNNYDNLMEKKRFISKMRYYEKSPSKLITYESV